MLNRKLILLALTFVLPIIGYCQLDREAEIHRELPNFTQEGRDKSQIPKKFEYSPRSELFGKILITNSTGNTIFYQTSTDNLNWTNQSILNGYQSTFTIQGLYINIISQVKSVNYYLYSGYRYFFSWNAKLNCWDIFVDP